MKKVHLITLILIAIIVSCTAQTSDNNISPEEFKKKISEGDVILLDVRTEGEVRQGKIPGALNIDIHDSKFVLKISQLDKSKTILVYCASGGRSGRAMKQLRKKGFTVYNLSGGISAWITKGYKTE